VNCVESVIRRQSLTAALGDHLADWEARSVADSAPATDTVSRVVTTARRVRDTAPASDGTITEGGDDGR